MASVHLPGPDKLLQWALDIAAPSDLAWLVRRLSRASGGPSANVEFATGKGIYDGWFDGTVSTEIGDAKLPIGDSVWEVSTRSDVKKKADEDIKKRSDPNLGIDIQNTTYVGVTLRRWGKFEKDSWCKSWEKTGWKQVKFFDVDDLSEWLDQHRIVHYQLSNKIGGSASSARDLEEWWRNIVERATCDVNDQWLLSGRDESCDELGRLLKQGSPTVRIAGPGTTESLAFLYATICRLTPSERDWLLCRTLFVPTVDGLSDVCANVDNAIIVPGCSLTPAQFGLTNGNRLVLCGDSKSGPATVEVPRIRSSILHKSLTDSGMDFDLADRVTKQARTGFVAMLTALGADISPFDPNRIEAKDFAKLTACLLVNRWDSSEEADRFIIAELASCSYDELEVWAIKESLNEMPFIRQSGTVWFLTEDSTAWSAYKGILQPGTLRAYPQLFRRILHEEDPSYEMPINDRWKAGLFGKLPRYSGRLKQGLTRSLAVIAELDIQVGNFVVGQELANHLVEECFDSASAQRWYSIAPWLPTLAEAAPEPLLTAIEQDLTSSAYEIGAGLDPKISSPLTGGTRHYELLWALERLAWSKEYIARATLALGRLSARGFGKGSGNSPLNSLREIFLPWHPSTEASYEDRVAALNALRHENAGVAWELLVLLMPDLDSVSASTSRPEFRDWSEPALPKTNADLHASYQQIIVWALEDAGLDPNRWNTLISVCAGYPEDWFELFLSALKAAEPKINNTDDRAIVWNALRSTMHRHHRFPEANWTMSTAQSAQLGELMETFTPSSLLQKKKWLFEQWVDWPEAGDDYERKEALVSSARVTAVKDIQESLGLAGILSFASEVSSPGLVGNAAAILNCWDDSDEDLFLSTHLASFVSWQRNLAWGYAYERVQTKSESWALSKLKGRHALTWSTAQRAELYLLLGSERSTWQLVERETQLVRSEYWRQVSIWRTKFESDEDREYFARLLFEVKRGVEIVDWLAADSYNNWSPTIAQLALDALAFLQAHPPVSEEWQSGLVHHVSRLFEMLGEQPGMDLPQLARLEFYFMPALRYQYRPRALARAMGQDPALFLELVSLAFKQEGKAGAEPSVDKQALASNAYTVLHDWRDLPGVVADSVDEKVLSDWVKRARALAAEKGFSKGADISIGGLLAYAPNGPDNVWPHEAICRIIESCDSETLDLHVFTGRLNSRGVTWRSVDDGGAQERHLEGQYRAYAKKRSAFVRTRTILIKLADHFRRDAIRENKVADMNQDL